MATCPNTTTASKIDRAAIIREAWRRWRNVLANYEGWQIGPGKVGGTFADALRTAWRVAKEDAANTAREFAIITGPNAPKVIAIRQEIEALVYCDSRVDIAVRRHRLEAELASLSVAA
ncbi:MAG TPA: hypothetical protein VGN97_21825 [Mesorhizobium sp.]|jgi:hypothetical protein|nr:hypothetical protein [Mesorhizobium sp.]